MKVKKFSSAGAESGTANVSDDIFGYEINESAIHAVIRAESRNRRHGTRDTKDFSEVSGGGKKPWRQKGTGHARQGSIRAPQWRKGAVVFGPKPRDYTLKISDRLRRVGIVSILSKKAKAEQVVLIDQLKADKFSTKSIYSVFAKAGNANDAVVYVMHAATPARKTSAEKAAAKGKKPTDKLIKSFSNIPNMKIMHAQRLNAPELLYADRVFFSDDAIKYLEENYKLTSKRKSA